MIFRSTAEMLVITEGREKLRRNAAVLIERELREKLRSGRPEEPRKFRSSGRRRQGSAGPSHSPRETPAGIILLSSSNSSSTR